MPPNPLEETKPSETAMETANAICGSNEGARNIVSAAVVADSKYAPLVEAGANLESALAAYQSSLKTSKQDGIFFDGTFADRENFAAALARATPKGGADAT